MKKAKTAEETTKITVHIPTELLDRALVYSKEGITETVRRALFQYAANPAYEAIMKMRGKVKFSITPEQMREDRE